MGSNIYNVCYKYSYYIIYINKQYIYLFHDNPTLYSATKYHKIALVLVKKINQFRFWWLFSLLAKPSNHQVHISKYSKGTIEFPFSVSNSSVTWSILEIYRKMQISVDFPHPCQLPYFHFLPNQILNKRSAKYNTWHPKQTTSALRRAT